MPHHVTTAMPERPPDAHPPDPTMRAIVVATVVCIAGCAVLIAAGSAQLVIAAGIVLGGTAFVLVIAGAFYAVGRSEDRERAEREARQR